MKKLILVFMGTLMLNGIAIAKDSDKQALNICALAIPLLNQYIVNYEYLYGQRHGLAARVEYAPMSDDAISSTGKAVVLNYRWHFSKSMESIFAGPYARYREIIGTGSVGGAAFNFTIPEWTIGVNVGKRWVWRNGFNVVLSAGLGVSTRTETVNPTNAAIDSAITTLKTDHPTYFNTPSYGEFSIGYVF
jgi:hypothetical protein